MSHSAQEPAEQIGRSESSGPISHLIIGRILGARGVKGELRVQILTDFPQRFTSLKRVYIGDRLAQYEVETARPFKGMVLLKLRGVDTVDQAEPLRGEMVKVPVEEAVRLSKDLFYWHQVIGLEVWTTAGERVGKVVDILVTGANDVYVVLSDSREVLIPAIADVVREISPEKGKIVIEPLPGLLE